MTVLERQLAASLIWESERQAKRLWAERDKAMYELFEELTGYVLPKQVPFQTPDGSWYIEVSLRLKKVSNEGVSGDENV